MYRIFKALCNENVDVKHNIKTLCRVLCFSMFRLDELFSRTRGCFIFAGAVGYFLLSQVIVSLTVGCSSLFSSINTTLFSITEEVSVGLMVYSTSFWVCFGLLWLNALRLVKNKKSVHFLDQSEVKLIKPIMTCSHAFSRASGRLHVFTSSSDWFIVLFASCDWSE